ncbi:V-type ATP synthase subunit E [Oceanispirochaeta sp.]|jgi:V/A-type H+-transporting ATPase subunit E|uniref:V-type ATP synthase subunit E n=1 Tax=Oceanispirochaeta sp. TaxID=2035350 RepID=UPI00263671C2|nr:V-type ATP synthase subunit E [Oceanispirochaeta sp.]MDA3955552.1 V-type ATP synthase subunit E [Oceanispirochaeta sp.]
MDVQVKELIEKIKNDGVKNAEENSSRIIFEAEKKAAALIENAEKEASDIKSQAQNEASRMEQAGKEALKQAGRDLLLGIKKDVEDLFDRILQSGTAEVLKGDSLKDCIVTVLKSWKDDEIKDLSVLVAPETLKSMESQLKSELKAQVEKGLEIKPFSDLNAGFRISVKDGRAFYDFSDKELMELLSKYLNPGLMSILEK